MSLVAEIRDRLASERDGLTESMAWLQGEGLQGYARVQQNNVRYVDRALDLAEMIVDIREGRRRTVWLIEAMSMSDFPALFGYTIERIVLDSYDHWPQTWPRLARRRVVSDFRNIEVHTPLFGGGTRLEEVPELSEYPAAPMTPTPPILYKVKKYGRRMGFSFEAGVSDALDQLDNIPRELGQAARETENYGISELYADANGPSAALYSVPNNNIIPGNPPLNVEGLQAGMTLLMSRRDEEGVPIFLRGVTLVVPPALMITANNMVNAIQIELESAGGTANQRVIAKNWMSSAVTVVVDPYLPIIVTNSEANTQWYLFADPLTGARPALEIAFLRGHEQPELWLKEPDARRVGNGAVDPMDGSFDVDAIDYRVRHILGVSRIDPRMTVASEGDGT